MSGIGVEIMRNEVREMGGVVSGESLKRHFNEGKNLALDRILNGAIVTSS